MKSRTGFYVVLVTAPDLETARALAKAALELRLAACANIIPNLESHYWWDGKLDSSSELLLLFKTEGKCLAALERTILGKHPYDTPEFIALPIVSGTEKYLKWLGESCQP
jgi:periplasmic divalent cation tolerance protein